MKRFVALVAVLTMTAVLGGDNAMAQPVGKTVLRVLLYPYLPAPLTDATNSALYSRIETEFERQHPEIDLQFVPFDPKADDLYDWRLSARLLEDAKCDLIEVDSVMLGQLMDMELLEPWADIESQMADWRPAAKQAFEILDKQFAIPHWMCGHFVITRDATVAKATTLADLIAAVRNVDPATRNIVGDFLGSWNTASLYLDAWADLHGTQDLDAALRQSPDAAVIKALRDLVGEGMHDGRNPNKDGTYDDNDEAPAQFAAGQADALIGYSERLHAIKRINPKTPPLYISSLPFGSASAPIWFVDGFALRKAPKQEDRTLSDARRAAARKFTAYMNHKDTFRWIHLAEDMPAAAPPRYLIPATLSAFTDAAFTNDPLMAALASTLDTGRPIPSSRLPGLRRLLVGAIAINK